jgi:Histidyl-tRNA synthetase
MQMLANNEKKLILRAFKFAIIVGQDELKSKKVKLKNLKEDNPDLELKEKDLLEYFKC